MFEDQREPPADCLARLGPQARGKWRCLQVLMAFEDLAHAARRLHLSQAALRELLLDLQQRLGAEHLRLEGERVALSAALRQALRTRRCAG